MNFKEAIKAVQTGEKVTRKVWLESNGGARGLMRIVGARFPYRGITWVRIEPFVAQFEPDGRIYAYQPANEDKMATDFEIMTG